MPDTSDLPALLASRLLHDLTGPLGALGNGIELLEMTVAPSPELDLMRDAMAAMQARLRLYRLAFGAATPGAQVAGPELAGLVAAAAPQRVTCRADLPAVLDRAMVRSGLLAMLCAQSALAWGGSLDMHHALDTWTLTAESGRLRIEARLWHALAEGQPPPGATPPEVHFALLARTLRAPPHLEIGATRLVLSF